MRKKPIGVDLFAGAGGLSLGFEQAGFDVLAAVEYDPIHAATHEFNFPDCDTICRSVADISGDYIRSRSKIGKSEIDVVFGGAPCQGFSMIGKRALEDPRNHLVYHFVRVVSELKPRFFVFENVRGLTVGEHRKFLQEIISEFTARGYTVRDDYQVLNAVNFGVPQDRQRLFLMGAREKQDLPHYPAQTHRKQGFNLDLGFLLETAPTVWDAIGDLPEADNYDELLNRDWVEAEYGTSGAYAKNLRNRLKGGNPNLLTSSLRTVHTALSQQRFKATLAGTIEDVSRFHKLDPEGVCNTLRAGTASDHGAFTSPRPIHPFSARCITVREAARIHSYPDWFRFHVTKWHGFRQVGNSVPPLLGQAVASKIVEQVGHKAEPDVMRRVGDPRLLELNMSAAAEHFGVSSTVIAQRTRKSASETVHV
jgi:DNA (cytosine-5)-methyltransferase 1